MEQKKIWDYFQGEGKDSFRASYARLGYLANITTPKDKVLNIGIGNGELERLAAARGVEVYSIDPSADAITALGKELGTPERFVVGYAQQMPFRNDFFSIVFISEVMEHLDDATNNLVLAEICRVLMPGGRIIGTVPANENLPLQTVICPDCGKHFHRWGHVQSWSARRMTEFLSSHFTNVRVEAKIFVAWRLLNWKGKLGSLVKALLLKLGVHGENESLCFVAKKPLHNQSRSTSMKGGGA